MNPAFSIISNIILSTLLLLHWTQADFQGECTEERNIKIYILIHVNEKGKWALDTD